MKVTVYIDNFGGVCQDVQVFTDSQKANEAFQNGLLGYKSYRLQEEDLKKLPNYEEYLDWMELSNGGAAGSVEETRLAKLESNFPILAYTNAEDVDFRLEEVEFECEPLERLRLYAQQVINTWEDGDLASAVNKLESVLKMMEE